MQELPLKVPKVWGSELWLVNEDEYCAKLLTINKGSSGSLHYHPRKKETFIVTSGKVKLQVDGKIFRLNAGPQAITLPPNTPHRFTGLKQSCILEISTHHDDNDVVRIEESKK